jgi:hypothetical protein
MVDVLVTEQAESKGDHGDNDDSDSMGDGVVRDNTKGLSTSDGVDAGRQEWSVYNPEKRAGDRSLDSRRPANAGDAVEKRNYARTIEAPRITSRGHL